ncbi:hypothetical protein BKA83DRAFT_4129610 [Pisolithus microcarpus]|nr:hypothetical protein BKA83DRAFT_4129610 [Pisolithus microcarpus]
MGFPHDYYVAVENLQLGSCGFPMGVEIPQLPEWDFSITIMWQWRISNWSFGDSPWVWRFSNCGFSMGVEILQVPEWDFSNPLMGGWGFSMGVEIFQVPEWDFSNSLMGGWGFSNWAVGDSPWDFSNPLMGGWGFSMGVEIPQLLEWDLSIPLMGGWAFSNWAVGHFHGCGDSPTARMGLPYDYYVAVENLQLGSWGFSMGVEISQVQEWDFSTPIMGMGILQLGIFGFSLGMEIQPASLTTKVQSLLNSLATFS